mmetsp:Transcript_81496/g.242911  ORF Transcript_81496/g.242911 Transcript_81496/m.242911 type:complete len:323 (+) Transcript_81496:476-1444(+)
MRWGPRIPGHRRSNPRPRAGLGRSAGDPRGGGPPRRHRDRSRAPRPAAPRAADAPDSRQFPRAPTSAARRSWHCASPGGSRIQHRRRRSSIPTPGPPHPRIHCPTLSVPAAANAGACPPAWRRSPSAAALRPCGASRTSAQSAWAASTSQRAGGCCGSRRRLEAAAASRSGRGRPPSADAALDPAAPRPTSGRSRAGGSAAPACLGHTRKGSGRSARPAAGQTAGATAGRQPWNQAGAGPSRGVRPRAARDPRGRAPPRWGGRGGTSAGARHRPAAASRGRRACTPPPRRCGLSSGRRWRPRGSARPRGSRCARRTHSGGAR